MNPSFITSTDIFLDIIGAFFISKEGFFPFKGETHIENFFDDAGKPPKEANEYRKWKSKNLKLGFMLLCFGYILQGIASWL